MTEFRDRLKAKRKALTVEMLGDECIVCGYKPTNYYHKFGEERKFALSQGWQYGLAKFIEEVKKCEAKCARCFAEEPNYEEGDSSAYRAPGDARAPRAVDGMDARVDSFISDPTSIKNVLLYSEKFWDLWEAKTGLKRSDHPKHPDAMP